MPSSMGPSSSSLFGAPNLDDRHLLAGECSAGPLWSNNDLQDDRQGVVDHEHETAVRSVVAEVDGREGAKRSKAGDAGDLGQSLSEERGTLRPEGLGHRGRAAAHLVKALSAEREPHAR